jgi:hypothetical protein
MERQYVAGYLNISVDSVNRKNPAMKALMDSVYRVSHNFKSATAPCLESKKDLKSEIFLSFSADKISVTAHLETRGFGYDKGMHYLFFMDRENKIKRMFKVTGRNKLKKLPQFIIALVFSYLCPLNFCFER